jgi:hypothetical protein
MQTKPLPQLEGDQAVAPLSIVVSAAAHTTIESLNSVMFINGSSFGRYPFLIGVPLTVA